MIDAMPISIEENIFYCYLEKMKNFLKENNLNKSLSFFISYARGVETEEKLVEQLFLFLRKLDLTVFYDNNKDNTIYGNPPTTDIENFIDNINKVNYVILFGSEKLMEKYKQKDKIEHVICEELEIIKKRKIKIRKKTKNSKKF